jgi:oxygen tolerance protein BatD
VRALGLRRRWFACVSLMLLAGGADAATQIQARLERSTIAVGEATTLEVVVSGASGTVSEPEFTVPPGLEVLGTGRAQNFTWINGKSSVEIIYRFEISANAPGRFAIGPITVRVGKEAFRSEVLSLEASAAPTRIGGGGSTAGPASLLVDVIPPQPWVGQPCQLRVRLVLRASLAEDPQYTPPATPGFWTDKTGAPESYYADERGQRVLVTETRTRLYPLAPGEATVGEASAVLALAGAERDPLAWLGGQVPRREAVVRSQPLPVRVRALPPGAPASFTGAVGSLSARWSADRARTSVDVPVTVHLDLRGVGNLPLVRPPELTGNDIEVFASTVEDSLAPPGATGAGRKRFQWTVLARRTGHLTLSAPAFAWFDPATASYRRAELSPIDLEVGPALFTGTGENAGLPPAFALHPIDPGGRSAEPWAWSLAGLMLGAALALWRSGGSARTAAAARAQPLEWLRAVGRTSGPDFWRAADEASAWLGTRGESVEGLRRQIAASRYGGAGADAESIRAQLVERISRALPAAPATAARRTGAVALVVAAGVWCILFGPRPGDPQKQAAVRAADQAAREGDLGRARDQWAALWRGGVHHPGLAARLAWADAQSGAVGQAAAWVARGERAGVRDPALRWIAGRVREGGGLIGDVPVRWPVRPIEWAIAALLLGATAGAMWPNGRRVALLVVLCLLAGAIQPFQGMIAARSGCAVVQETVTLEGAGLELQPGQVVRLLERRGGRARVSAGGGVGGWVPESSLDIVHEGS